MDHTTASPDADYGKRILNWIVWTLGLLPGILILAVVGAAPLWWHINNNDLVTYAVTMTGMVLILASLLSLRNRRKASYLYFALIVLYLLLGTFAVKHSPLDPPGIDIWYLAPLTICTTLSLFWLFTAWRGWPPLTQKKPSIGRMLFAMATIFVTITITAAAFDLILGRSIYDCSGDARPFARPKASTQKVFVAKIVYSNSEWALGIVQHHYWGLPVWNHKIVLLKGSLDRRTYFIESFDTGGFITRFIPILEAGRTCTRTALIENAEVDLRLLDDGPPKDHARIIERVVTLSDVPPYTKGVPGVHVVVSSPAGEFPTVTDAQGIYDVTVPPGKYSVLLPESEPRQTGGRLQPCSLRQYTVGPGDVWGCLIVVK